jgi:predicted transposase YbfD/YdcC
VFGVLIADGERLYDPRAYHDRLLLGLSGIMSEAELHQLRMRLHQGERQKAARGELRLPLPAGLAYDRAGTIILNPDEEVIADKIVEHKADYLLALKGNQPTLEAEVADYFNSAPAEEVVIKNAEIEKGHGRIEMRTYTASSKVDWIVSERSYPGETRFTNIKTLVKVFSRREHADRCTFETRYYISSAALDIDRLANGERGHWGVESMHWLLDVESRTISRATAPVTAPRTWPSCAALLSASSAPISQKEASKHEENPQVGAQIISSNSFSSNER